MRAAVSPPPTQFTNQSTRLAGPRLSLVRALWLAMFALYVGLFVLGAPAAFQQALTVSNATAQELIARDVSPYFPAYYLILLDTVTMIAFAGIALFIVLRQPDDWMVMLSSLTLVGTAVLYTVPAPNAPVPIWIPAFAIALGEILQVAFVFLFPIGQFIPRWLGWLLVPMLVWRPLIWVLVYLPGHAVTTHTAENYGTLRQDGFDTGLMLLLFVIGIGAQVYRYRKVYNNTQRLQTKWVLWGILIAVVVTGTWVLVVNAAGLLQGGGANELFLRMLGRTIRQIALFMVPLTLAFSILRYRLWDIDVLLRRTLVYVPITAILAGVFAALISLSQVIAVALTGSESIFATIVTTMVVVALVEPVQYAMQNLVDRRFKDVPDPYVQLQKFGDRVERRLSAVRTKQILRRFADQAINAFQADGGGAYLVQNHKPVRYYSRGRTADSSRILIEVRVEGHTIGGIELGERCDQRPYSKQDYFWLENTAAIVGSAIAQDTALASLAPQREAVA